MVSGGTGQSARLWWRMGCFWLMFACMLFAPAGSLRWLEAWIFLGIYFAWSLPVVVWLSRHDPELLRERLKGPVQEGQKSWDKALVLATLPPFLALLVVPGLDAVRFGWSLVPLPLKVAAFVLIVPALGLVFWTMKENAYLSKVVRIQYERGHRVVSTGPYAVVRHPMYAGMIVLLVAMPVALGSFYALIAGALVAGLIVVRTALEDRTLHAELEGYEVYASKVRFRIVPGIW